MVSLIFVPQESYLHPHCRVLLSFRAAIVSLPMNSAYSLASSQGSAFSVFLADIPFRIRQRQSNMHMSARWKRAMLFREANRYAVSTGDGFVNLCVRTLHHDPYLFSSRRLSLKTEFRSSKKEKKNNPREKKVLRLPGPVQYLTFPPRGETR